MRTLYHSLKVESLFCLFVLGFNVSLTCFQSYCDGTCMRQVIVLPHWNAPVAGTWQEHPTQSHYKLTPGRPAIFPSAHLSMPTVSKGAPCTILTTFGMSRLGIEPATFRTLSKRSTSKPPGSIACWFTRYKINVSVFTNEFRSCIFKSFHYSVDLTREPFAVFHVMAF